MKTYIGWNINFLLKPLNENVITAVEEIEMLGCKVTKVILHYYYAKRFNLIDEQEKVQQTLNRTINLGTSTNQAYRKFILEVKKP